ncbi:40S ribosomal protein S20 [Colletotrichum nymphaeae SA-01]|nr:40S ribosomal protein S20 [Colletotrichum nymphaeae SA-01]
MSYNKDKDFGEAPKTHKIRITLSSRKVQSLEKVSAELIERAKSKDLRVSGPVRLPTKTLKVTTRKTPCGEGSKTWDCFEMRIHKRLIDLNAPTEIVKQIIINIEAGVEVEVTIAAQAIGNQAPEQKMFQRRGMAERLYTSAQLCRGGGTSEAV